MHKQQRTHFSCCWAAVSRVYLLIWFIYIAWARRVFTLYSVVHSQLTQITLHQHHNDDGEMVKWRNAKKSCEQAWTIRKRCVQIVDGGRELGHIGIRQPCLFIVVVQITPQELSVPFSIIKARNAFTTLTVQRNIQIYIGPPIPPCTNELCAGRGQPGSQPHKYYVCVLCGSHGNERIKVKDDVAEDEEEVGEERDT